MRKWSRSGCRYTMTEGANRLTSRATSHANPGPSIPAAHLRAFVAGFGGLGYDTNALLEACAVDAAALDDPDALVPATSCDRFIRLALERRPLRNLGVRLAAATPPGTFPLLDYLALTSEDVGQAFTRVARYIRLTSAPLVIEINEKNDPVELRYATLNPNDRFSVEYSATLHVLRAREETDGR